MHLVVFSYSTSRYEQGHVYSKHKSEALARRSARKSGYDSFLAVVEVPTGPRLPKGTKANAYLARQR